MAREDTTATLRRLIAVIINADVPANADLRQDIPRWDSLKHIEIIFAVEDHFGITLNEETIAQVEGITSLAEAVEQALAT